MIRRLRSLARRVRREALTARFILRDPRTPARSKWLLGAALGYFVLPFDLLPDWLPVIGQLDDVVIVGGLLYLAYRTLPPDVLADARARARRLLPPDA